MQQIEQAGTLDRPALGGPALDAPALGGLERRRVEAVVQTLANLRCKGETLAEVAHDARNMVAALALYCDLLEEPGVLAAQFLHYGGELRLVASASHRLVEKLVALDTRQTPFRPLLQSFLQPSGSASSQATSSQTGPGNSGKVPEAAATAGTLKRSWRWDLMPAEPIDSLAAELLANRSLLAALAGPSIALTLHAEGGARPVRLTGEDLTRVLVNLVKNAAEAMPAGGRIQLGLRERPPEPKPGPAKPESGPESKPDSKAAPMLTPMLILTIEDDGPGIPRKALEKIFESGYTTNTDRASANNGGWPAAHRGLGLAITRSVLESAGGRIHALNRTPAGARFEIELPVRTL